MSLKHLDIFIWKIGMTRYCNSEWESLGGLSGWCYCDNMHYCDYCPNSSGLMPCAKAIIKMCQDMNIPLNFKRKDYDVQLAEIENAARAYKNKKGGEKSDLV